LSAHVGLWAAANVWGWDSFPEGYRGISRPRHIITPAVLAVLFGGGAIFMIAFLVLFRL
jgi:hypothetical protein